MQLMRIAHMLMGNNGRTVVLKAEHRWVACFCNMINVVWKAVYSAEHRYRLHERDLHAAFLCTCTADNAISVDCHNRQINLFTAESLCLYNCADILHMCVEFVHYLSAWLWHWSCDWWKTRTCERQRCSPCPWLWTEDARTLLLHYTSAVSNPTCIHAAVIMQCYMSLTTNQLLVVMSAKCECNCICLVRVKLHECYASTWAVQYFASHYIDAKRRSLFFSFLQAATALLK